MEKKLNTYTNGNHKVTIYSDGTKIKETIDPKADHFTYDFPENFDIKINASIYSSSLLKRCGKQGNHNHRSI